MHLLKSPTYKIVFGIKEFFFFSLLDQLSDQCSGKEIFERSELFTEGRWMVRVPHDLYEATDSISI